VYSQLISNICTDALSAEKVMSFTVIGTLYLLTVIYTVY
jgi:hypothetical protein